ncbi:MAG: acyl-CoA/acyl-ACP dehydrogenase [Chloroflexi bacterium]|nr:acyl-CoA/acyl-ACP dehydrogenase [Chloroflexota bacterium]
MTTGTSPLQEIRDLVERVALETALVHRDSVDRDGRWPVETMRALAAADLLGLHVPQSLGGRGEGLAALVAACEALAQVCPSAALCFGMHCVATAVITAKATSYQKERYLRPIAEGKHITTLALSERGSGSHFYIPQTQLRLEGSEYAIDGEKHFVTSGGYADSYVVSTVASDAQAGQFSCVLVDHGLPGMTWGEAWQGLGMRGNQSRALRLNGARVPREALLGEQGDQIWYIFEVVAPYFLMAMSGAYLGIAAAALKSTTDHLASRQYTHSGERLAEVAVIQHRLGAMWIQVHRTRALVYQAAHMGDARDPEALVPILACKADVADMVESVTNEAMTLCGGAAYAENSFLARLLRDARAAHVMSPTTDILKTWAGRALLSQPLL